MVWIPICFVAVVIYTIRAFYEAAQEGKRENKESAFRNSYSSFCNRVKLSQKQRDEIDNRLFRNREEEARVIYEFMGDGDPDWKLFYGSPWPAYMALSAEKYGKLYDSSSIRYMLRLPGKKGRWPNPEKDWVMTEKFLLRVEDELNKHGVHTTIVANYLSDYKYSSVREHVRTCGYGNHRPNIEYRWSNMTYQWAEFDH